MQTNVQMVVFAVVGTRERKKINRCKFLFSCFLFIAFRGRCVGVIWIIYSIIFFALAVLLSVFFIVPLDDKGFFAG